MKRIYLTILLTSCTCSVSLESKEPQCFRFTWLGSGDPEGNCTIYNEKYPNIPCIEPIHSGETRTDTIANVWKNFTQNPEDPYPELEPMNSCVCIKYTYIYNGAAINATYFCGKIIEDQTTPITSGCYVAYTEGYTIEACACQSKEGKPCNSSVRNTYSILITFMATCVPWFIYKISNIFP